MKRFALSRRKFFAAILSAPLTTAADAVAIEPTWVKIRNFKLSEKPSARVVHFTDIHHKGNRRYLEKVVSAINDLQPDFACFTGDLVEDSCHAPEALEVLSAINCPLYGIPGNHDHWADLDFDLPRATFAKTGGRWLMNEQVEIKEHSVHLFGLSGLEPYDFHPAKTGKNILLSHYPSGVDNYRQTRFDLALAGHSHGGQVRLPGYGALIVPFGVGEYQLGMYKTPAGPLYVSSGIGWFYANVRLFCRPEVVLFEI